MNRWCQQIRDTTGVVVVGVVGSVVRGARRHRGVKRTNTLMLYSYQSTGIAMHAGTLYAFKSHVAARRTSSFTKQFAARRTRQSVKQIRARAHAQRLFHTTGPVHMYAVQMSNHSALQSRLNSIATSILPCQPPCHLKHKNTHRTCMRNTHTYWLCFSIWWV